MLVPILSFFLGCLIIHLILMTFYLMDNKDKDKDENEKEKEKNSLKPDHTIDNWTSAQPPPPLSSNVSPNIVYPSNCLCGRRLGIDCANATCCNDYPNLYIYDDFRRPAVYTHPHGFEIGYRGPRGPSGRYHEGPSSRYHEGVSGHHKGVSGHHA